MKAKEYLKLNANEEQVDKDNLFVVAIDKYTHHWFSIDSEQDLPEDDDLFFAITEYDITKIEEDIDCKTWNDKPVGYYEPFINDDDNQTEVVNKGETYYMIKLPNGTFYDTSSQDVAEQLSLICKMKSELKLIKKMLSLKKDTIDIYDDDVDNEEDFPNLFY